MDSNSDMGEEKTDSNTRVEDEARFPRPLSPLWAVTRAYLLDSECS